MHLGNPFFKDFPSELIEKIERNGLRNVTLLTIPPTGSIAAMAGVTSGIEPIFDINYVRRSESLSERVFEVEHPLVAEYRKITESRKEDPLPSYFRDRTRHRCGKKSSDAGRAAETHRPGHQFHNQPSEKILLLKLLKISTAPLGSRVSKESRFTGKDREKGFF